MLKTRRKSVKTAETLETLITATTKYHNQPAFSDSFDPITIKTDDSQRYSSIDPFGQITQINDVVLFPALGIHGSLQVKSGVIQMDSQDIKKPDQQQGQAQMCDVCIDKTSMANLVFTHDKSHKSNVPTDDAGHSVEPSCDIPLMDIVVPQGKANVIREDNVSMDSQDIQQTDLQKGQVQM
jgi:hypothetical protein